MTQTLNLFEVLWYDIYEGIFKHSHIGPDTAVTFFKSKNKRNIDIFSDITKMDKIN